MKKRIILIITTVVFVSLAIAIPVFAEEEATSSGSNCVPTIFFGGCAGEGTMNELLKTIVNIFTVIVGAVAVGAIAFAGAQYLTAGGNEEKLRKSKHRIIEIVIGLAIYLLLYAILNFLLPSFNGTSV